uniref:Uncharacterized protein n=1 Tax=Cacopsylla melanoneura TaxID=428564 RepID=A0A8D9FC36_9HEMI
MFTPDFNYTESYLQFISSNRYLPIRFISSSHNNTRYIPSSNTIPRVPLHLILKHNSMKKFPLHIPTLPPWFSIDSQTGCTKGVQNLGSKVQALFIIYYYLYCVYLLYWTIL